MVIKTFTSKEEGENARGREKWKTEKGRREEGERGKRVEGRGRGRKREGSDERRVYN